MMVHRGTFDEQNSLTYDQQGTQNTHTHTRNTRHDKAVISFATSDRTFQTECRHGTQ